MPPSIKILFGTETGTAEGYAEDLAAALHQRGYAADVIDLCDADATAIADEPMVVVVTSTFGNGDPPANAEDFLRTLREHRPPLDGLPFAVLALGDSSFPRFAQCGRDVDDLLAELGGQRAIDRVDVDGDAAAPMIAFQNQLLAHLSTVADAPRQRAAGSAAPSPKPPDAPGLWGKVKSWFGATPAPAPTAPRLDRRNPATGTLVDQRRLTAEASDKDTRHYGLDLGDAGASLRPGDCVGVLPANGRGPVADVLAAAGCAADEAVVVGSTRLPVGEAVAGRCLRRVPVRLLDALGGDAAAVARSPSDYEQLAQTHDVVSVLHRWPRTWSPQDLIDRLHPLAPRSYSVANRVDGPRVELCVDRQTAQVGERTVEGVAASWLASLSPGATVRWFPEPHPAFHLPDDARPLILVATGTGIAPFRGYLQELAAGATERPVWLFFGHRRAALDHLYADEIERWTRDGLLDRHTTAWSRDGGDKVYVQDRLREHEGDVRTWLTEGARVRLCGTTGMAPPIRDLMAAWLGDDAFARARADGTYLEEVY